MDEKTGQTVNDISENGLSATLGLNSSVNTDDPTWTTGKYGAGLSFDGGDYVARGTGPTIINTVSFWTYPTSTTNYFVDLNGSAYISAPPEHCLRPDLLLRPFMSMALFPPL